VSGRELLTMIVRQLQYEKIPPTDSAIVNKLRQIIDVEGLSKYIPGIRAAKQDRGAE